MRKLDKRKELASKVLGVGMNKICFDAERLSDIKEAITRQDIKELYQEGIITIKPKQGKRVKKKRKTRKGAGKVKKKVKNRKQKYVKLVRKLRKILKDTKRLGNINKEDYRALRVKVKANTFRDKTHLNEHMKEMKK